MFHQGAGIWRDDLRPGSGAADEAIAGTIGEESKPEAGAKRPPKTAQARGSNCTVEQEGETGEIIGNFIEAWPVW